MREKFKLYSEVQLTAPLPEYGFEKGDVATLVDKVHSKNGEQGYLLEFFDNNGQTLNVVAVAENYIARPPKHAVVNYRPYKAA
jgi:hypothetical protein